MIGFIELTRASQILSAATFKPLPVYGAAAVLYFIICYSLSRLSQRLEGRVHVAR